MVQNVILTPPKVNAKNVRDAGHTYQSIFRFFKAYFATHIYIYMHVRSLRRKHAKAKQQPLAKDCFVQTGHSLVVYEGAVAAL